MEELKAKATNLADDVGRLVDTYVKLAKVKAVEKSSAIISIIITAIIAVFLLMCFLFFIGIAASLWVGKLLENPIAGYLSVAGFYLLLIIILIALRKKIILPMIGNIIIRKVYE